MSKPAKFLRHPWTYRSDFQKTKDYSKVNLDECAANGAKILVPDSDDELSDSGRAVKRRRIENLAEGYLKGEKLFISSARPCPQALKSTIVRHKKSSTEPGFVLPEVNVPRKPSPIWAEAEDDDQILRRLLRSSKPKTKKRVETVGIRSEPIDAEPLEDVKAQASCRPQRRLRTANLGSDPSEEALRQAAALRNRRGRGATAQMATVTEESAEVVNPMSDPWECISVKQSERVLRSQKDKREWLSRRMSRFSFGGEGVHDAGETASHCIAQSSPLSRSPQETIAKSLHGEFEDRIRSPQKASYHTAPEHTEVFREPVEISCLDPLDEQLHLCGISTELATSTGSPGRIRTMRYNDAAGKEQYNSNDEDAQQQGSSPHDQANTSLASRASPKRSTTNTGTQSAPATRSRAAAELVKPAYVQALSTQNGTTPLMYRKRTTRSKASEQQPEAAPAPITRRSTRRRVTFPSSEDVQASGPQSAAQQEHVASHPPVLDLSFQPDYSFAPKLNMALVEEHSNKLLPAKPKSDGKTTSVKKALRRELRDSGAELSRCDSEPPASSQVEHGQQTAPQYSATAQSLAGNSGQNTSKMSNSERRQTWLGTQAMVARAERDLFTSPEKQRGAFTPVNKQTPQSARNRSSEPTPLSQEREPLKQLSQDPAPSTQAMLADFGGFSTVKKPRASAIFKHTDEPTPVAIEKGRRPESRAIPDERRTSFGTSSSSDRAKGNGRSNLRFSISSFKSPAPAEREKEPGEASTALNASNATSLATPAPSSSTRSTRKSALKVSNLKSAPERHLERTSSQTETRLSQSMSISVDFPSSHFLQRAQVPQAAPAGLLRDPSNMSQTLDDLTHDVLETSFIEVEGML